MVSARPRATGATRPTPTHTPIFHQVEGLAVDRGITLADLKGTLLHLLAGALRRGPRRSASGRATSRSPSRRSSPTSRASSAAARAAASCKLLAAGSRWAARASSTRTSSSNVGYDPEEVSGFAFGLGLERIAMLRHGIPDLRALWENDLRLLRAVLMKIPVSWLREYVEVDATTRELAERLAISTFEVERDLVPRRPGRRRQPRPLPRRARARGGQAPERRPAPALHGRRGRGRAAPDRLRRLELRRGRDGRGRAPGRRAARRPEARAGEAPRRSSRTG